MNAPTRRRTRHHAGAASDYVTGEFRRHEVGRQTVGVVRTDEGWYAVNNRCPHQGADLCAGLLARGTMRPSRPHEYVYVETEPLVVCPWHRWEFSLETGESVGHVTPKRVAVYPVEVVDGQVYVDVPGGAE